MSASPSPPEAALRRSLPHHLLRIIPGLALALAIGALGLWLVGQPLLSKYRVDPLMLAIVIGIALGALMGERLPQRIEPGVGTAQHRLLNLGILLYGARISLTAIAAIGLMGLLLDAFIVASTLGLGIFLGRRVLKLDRETSLLLGFGNAICGVAAILALARMIHAEHSKIAAAIAVVVVFSTLEIFFDPWLYQHVLGQLGPSGFGTLVGATVPAVGQVLAIGDSIGRTTTSVAIVVKLGRVMMLAPALLLLGWWLRRHQEQSHQVRVHLPWFAFGFVALSGLISLHPLTPGLHRLVASTDDLLLSGAMAAIGLETRISKVRALGRRPLLLGVLLTGWLFLVGLLGVYWMG